MTNRRGSVIVESALTLTVILFVLYGTLQLGMVGLEQLTVDGGAFTMAHQQSFAGGKVTYMSGSQLAQNTLPHLVSPNVAAVSTTGEPPATLFAGQYGFNTPNARYGGVSLVQPVQTAATITRSNIQNIVLGLAGSTFAVTGIAIEPTYRLINGHANVGGNTFGSAGAFATSADPFADDAPPYLVGFSYIQSCPYQIAGNSTPGTAVTPGWSTCPNGALVTALGSAEYLDAQNWSRPLNGVTPSQTAVFWETRYHQTLYASISTLLAGAPARTKEIILDPLDGDPRADDVACVYSFDNINVGAYAPGNTGINNPLFALHPDGISPTCPPR